MSERKFSDIERRGTLSERKYSDTERQGTMSERNFSGIERQVSKQGEERSITDWQMLQTVKNLSAKVTT